VPLPERIQAKDRWQHETSHSQPTEKKREKEANGERLARSHRDFSLRGMQLGMARLRTANKQLRDAPERGKRVDISGRVAWRLKKATGSGVGRLIGAYKLGLL
jgi:hypothetical protein